MDIQTMEEKLAQLMQNMQHVLDAVREDKRLTNWTVVSLNLLILLTP